MQYNAQKLISARRPEYDVMDLIKVSDGTVATRAMTDIFLDIFPDETALADVIIRHGELITQMYTGQHPEYRPCDTLYHDLQHTMDVSLCMARMLHGYESLAPGQLRLGPRVFCLGIIGALYHDSGYILHKDDDSDVLSGSSMTSTHVTRSSLLMKKRLSDIESLADLIDDATKILHYTGYEQKIENVVLATPAFHTVGKMLGSSDLLAQTADRCYLEKCRDRLFPEFVLGGLDYSVDGNLRYESALTLMVKTPSFYRECVRRRLEENLNSYYHYVGTFFGGINHYAWWMENNIHYLQILIDQNKLENLKRKLPKTYGQERFPYESMKVLMRQKKESWSLDRIVHSGLSLGGSN